MMSTSDSETPRWPERLKDLAGLLQSAESTSSLDQARAEAWEILNASISRYLRFHASRLGRISREDAEDLAAEKSLDLLRKAEVGAWDISDRLPSEITGFLSKVARNGLVDVLREEGRRVEPADENRPEWDVGPTDQERSMPATDSPDMLVERKEFAEALRRCAERLNPRSGLVWFLRVFCDMASKDIATHPEVNLKVGHVDVILQRCRGAIRDCMRRQGFQEHEMPTGVFVEVWKLFGQEES